MRVPLLMRYTGIIGADISSSVPVSNMDLMPTLLEYAGVTPPEGLSAGNRSLPPIDECYHSRDNWRDQSNWVYK